MKKHLRAVAVLVLLAGSIVGAEEPRSQMQPNILLITIDTLRPDALGWIAGRNATPNIDAIALSGVRFRAATTHVPLTLPAHASLFTSLIPPRHGVRGNDHRLSSEVETLAEMLSSRNYTCGAFVSAYPLAREFGLDQGFSHYDDHFPDADGNERSAMATTQAALEWVKTVDGPWFIWIHYWDPHMPYDPPRAFWKPGRDGAYLGEVEYVDHAIGVLVGQLDSEQTENRLTVITADHGESLGEHGEKSHGFFIYDSTIAVPLIFHWPGHLAAKEARETPRLVDVAPTLLDLLGGLPGSRLGDGRSLLPILQGRAMEVERGYIETLLPWRTYGWSPLLGFRSTGFKVIAAPSPEAFDLINDPSELKNLASSRGPAVRQATVEALALARVGSGRTVPASREALDRLEALGYVAPQVESETFPDIMSLADPKKMTAIRGQLQAAEAEAEKGNFEGAIDLFSEVLAVDPDNPVALIRSGWALLLSGDSVQAAERAMSVLQSRADHQEAKRLLKEARSKKSGPDTPSTTENGGVNLENLKPKPAR